MSGLVRQVDDLDVYRQAYQLILELHPWSMTLPKTEQFSGLADQIRRASRSVCANTAEGLGKQASRADFRRYVLIALGSANEVCFWLKLAYDLNYLNTTQFELWQNKYGQVCRMLRGLADSKT